MLPVKIVLFVVILVVFGATIHRLRKQGWVYHPATAIGLGLLIGLVAYIMFHS